MNFLNRILEFFAYFFRSKPEGYDIEKFGFTHIFLVTFAFVGAILIYVNRDKLKNSNKNILKFFVVLLFLQQVILYGWYIISGAFSIETSLPLYDCRVAIICLIYGVFFNNNKSKRIGIYLGFVGSIVALISPDLDRFIFPHYTWISFFVGHILLLWVSCYIFFVEEIEISFKKYTEVFIFTNILHIAVIIFNSISKSNYAFLSEPPIFKEVAGRLHPITYIAIMMLMLNFSLYLVHSYFMKSRDGKLKLSHRKIEN
ncbi:TIGR02206 family membrane protein [uncultured Parvimonas sp.]|uniref:YwaF family protein n=1 Tax=uncultured Parvimonas sp. TaxID=747372 RepID=UPI0028D11195|nr:TIGR02206 family membrane protein [uncultured Parvimonas sp.]